jgi:enoyl-CoA hydratase
VSSSRILIEHDDDGVVVVTLNRPEALNAADQEMHTAISKLWGELEATPNVRAVVLTGAGRAFSGGGDLQNLQNMVDSVELRRMVMAESAVIVRTMVGFSAPIVSAVNGPAIGLGCSLASFSDIVVMEEDAYFADPHVAIGLVAGDGGALTWPLNTGLQRTKEWLLLGGRITADEAFRFGLANRVVPKGESLAEAKSIARRFAALPSQALRETRRVLNQPLIARVDEALEELLATETQSFDEETFQLNLKKLLKKRRG